jgi:hypothetical protein
MQKSTYSFLDSVCVFAHPLAGAPIVITGEGAGRITIAMTSERTDMNVAADGTVMVSKMAGNTGTITIEVQQTSSAYKKILMLFNQVWNAETGAWATGTITIRNTSDGTGHICTGVAYVKMGEKTYERQGRMVSWTLMAADIQSIAA